VIKLVEASRPLLSFHQMNRTIKPHDQTPKLGEHFRYFATKSAIGALIHKRVQYVRTMIDLTQEKLLLTSQNYKIFDHPFKDGVLLKVRADKPKDRLFKRYSEFRYGNLRQWNREANEYLAALHRGCPEIWRLAGFYGYVSASEGPAIAVEKMTGPDGKLANSVAQELAALPKGDPGRKVLQDEVKDLLADLENGQIIVGDIGFHNIVRACERDGKLVVIDGLGERILLPLTLTSKWAFRLSSARRRKRLVRRVM